jgi:hypothetical protein
MGLQHMDKKVLPFFIQKCGRQSFSEACVQIATEIMNIDAISVDVDAVIGRKILNSSIISCSVVLLVNIYIFQFLRRKTAIASNILATSFLSLWET